MTKEELIEQMELCADTIDGKCPKYCPMRKVDFCTLYIIKDALKLLKEQDPRVMTLEEFQASENNPKWLETKDGKQNRWTLGNAGYEKFYDNWMMGYLPIEEYGKHWRCWTSRPTDEQREAVKWNG